MTIKHEDEHPRPTPEKLIAAQELIASCTDAKGYIQPSRLVSKSPTSVAAVVSDLMAQLNKK